MRDLQKQCLAKIEEAYTIAEKHFNTTIPRIPVQFSNKLTRTAGTVQYMRNSKGSIKMKLSVPILRDNPEEFLKDTPGHEAAHHIVHCVYGTNTQAHGREWKHVMRIIGQEPKRTHRMTTVARNPQDRIAAECMCMTHMITKQRVAKMRNGASYSCRKCRTPLKLGTQVDVLSGAIAATKAAQKPVVKKPAKVKGAKSNAERARELIAANPSATEAELVELLRSSDIPVKANMLKVVIKVNLPKVRG